MSKKRTPNCYRRCKHFASNTAAAHVVRFVLTENHYIRQVAKKPVPVLPDFLELAKLFQKLSITQQDVVMDVVRFS